MFTLENKINTNFWNATRGRKYDADVLDAITKNGSMKMPAQSLQLIQESMKEENIFRKLGTVIQTEQAGGTIHAVTLVKQN